MYFLLGSSPRGIGLKQKRHGIWIMWQFASAGVVHGCGTAPNEMPSNLANRRTVWIVDDSPLEAEVARKALGEGFTTRIFLDGSAVLEEIVASPAPDVLILDWVMPGVSGIEVWIAR